MIFMTDHQRGDTVLPEHPCRTPHLDRIIRGGLTFTQTFCTTAHCSPSRASFFSGLYPSLHGVWNNVINKQALSRSLKAGVRLWSEDLCQVGYDMRFVGKWHVSAEENPGNRGWKERRVSSGMHDHHGRTWDGYRTMDLRDRQDPRQPGEILRPGWGDYRLYGRDDSGSPHDEACVREALELLPQLARGDSPWCLYVGVNGPHDPYVVPGKYLDLYPPGSVTLPESYGDDLRDRPGLYRRLREQIWGQLPPAEAREALRHFWAYCSYMDELFGRLMGALEREGALENTLVVYLSDHGDYAGDHGLFCKGIPCFRGAYNVPNVLHWPAGLHHPGRRVSEFVSLVDFAPTLLELVGARSDRFMSGASLVPFLCDETPTSWRDAVFTQCNGVEVYATQRSVTTRTHKYVYNAFDFDELYDLERDPCERVNRGSDPAYGGVKRELARRLWRFALEQGDAAPSPYITVGLAPHGPLEAFKPIESKI